MGPALNDNTLDNSPSSTNSDKCKRYKCDRCQKTYSRKIHLRFHQMSHVPMYNCPNCTQTFTATRTLQNHQKQHLDTTTADNIPLRRYPDTSAKNSQTLHSNPLDSQTRSASVNSGASTGFQEYVFDSRSVHSAGSYGSGASGASAASRASGRRGPLSDWARAGMNALKEVGGACWRCKFLRKTVSMSKALVWYVQTNQASADQRLLVSHVPRMQNLQAG